MISRRLLIILVVFVAILTVQIDANVYSRVKRQWGFGYPLFGGIGNSWEQRSVLPYSGGYNAFAGR